MIQNKQSAFTSIRPAVVLSFILMIAGCNNHTESNFPADPSGGAPKSDAVNSAAPSLSEQQNSLIAAYTKKQDELTKQIVELKTKAEAAAGDAKTAILAIIPELEKQAAVIAKRISRLGTEGAADWAKATEGVKLTIEDLQKRLNDAYAKIK